MRFSHWVEYIAFRAAYGVLTLFPLPLLRPLLRGAGALCYMAGIRRNIAMTNLRASLGEEKSDAELRRIARECYTELGTTVAEIVRSDDLLRDPGLAFRHSGVEALREEAGKGKGVIVLTAHLGNFIVTGYLLRRIGVHMAFVAKEMKNPRVSREIGRIYERYGSRIIPVSGFRQDPTGGRKILRGLRDGETVVILNDQDAGLHEYRSLFFGLPTYIPSGPAQFAYRLGAPVVTGFATRKNGGIFVEFEGAIDYSRARNAGEAVQAILDEYTRRLERKVREAPEQYFWLHKKWKSVPEIQAKY